MHFSQGLYEPNHFVPNKSKNLPKDINFIKQLISSLLDLYFFNNRGIKSGIIGDICITGDICDGTDSSLFSQQVILSNSII